MKILKKLKHLVKKTGKSPAKKKGATKPPTRKKAKSGQVRKEKPIGKVTHFFGEIKVAVVKFSVPVSVGVSVRFRGATTDFAQVLKSMQYNHQPLKKVPKGKGVGVKVRSKVRAGDKVFSEK